ncbi:GAF domain-containing protein [uncultured Brevibacillus sp.]|uniref:GAF domain-containing protein n=1 Tax=uncultured Brevibacillus sp. TaxID=169970 RepID=UPI0025984400|nr:GAF domain-containing protein [uncultured Brevibacillus sp.]
MDKFAEELGKGISEAVGKVPWAMPTIAGIMIVAIVLFAIMTFWRLKKGSEVTIAGLVNIKPNEIVEQLKKDFDSLNEDDKQKTQLLRLMNHLTVEISNIICNTTNEEFFETRRSIYDYLLPGIGSTITKQKRNNHRVAIFVKDGDQLRIHQGIGYSTEGKKNLRLAMDSSAGYAFTTGELYSSGEVYSAGNRFKKHPKATKEYHSLICVPIKCGNHILGVLSVDGEEPNSFTKDDEDYLTYLTNSLYILLHFENFMEIMIESRKGGELDGVSNN